MTTPEPRPTLSAARGGPTDTEIDTPTISVVIINKNEPELAMTLRALGEITQDRSDTEIVVVDASSGRFEALRELGVDRWDDFAPVPGVVTIPHQRNRGLEVARGRIVVFLDAGCELFDGWLDALTGPILEGREKIVSGVWVDSPFDPGGEQIGDEPSYVESCPTLTVAISREVFDSIGGFDESFAYGSDLDFCWRARHAGFRIMRNPAARVRANWGSPKRRLKRSYLYGRARVRLVRKHRMDVLRAVPRHSFAYPLYLLLLPLTLKFRWLPLFAIVQLARSVRRGGVMTEVFKYYDAAGVIVEVVKPTNRKAR